MKRYYISGPMRGIPKYNFPAFDASAATGRKMGHGIMSPADMDRELGHTENDPPSEVNTSANQRRFATRDAAAILALRAEDGDGIALLPGWEGSTGAPAEILLAKWVHLQPVSGDTFQPLTQKQMDDLDLTQLIRNIRRWLGDKNWDEYCEMRLDGPGMGEED